MRQKINLRLLEIALLAVLATMVSVTLICYSVFQRQVKKDLSIEAELLRDTGFFKNKTGGTDVAEQLGDSLTFDARSLRVTWIDTDGTVLYDNDTDVTGLENHADRPEFKEALKKGTGECVRNSVTMQMNTLYYAIRLEDGTVLRVSRKVRSIGSVFLTAFPLMLVIFVVIIVVCILLAHFLTRQLLAPIEAIAQDVGKSDAATTKMVVYKELVPFMNTIRRQHENILAAAKSRQDFTANVSHELKTPLTAISGYAELIENNMVDAQQVTHFAQEIRKNAERLLSLINDIIRLSELDGQEAANNYEMVDLYELAKECMSNLQVNANQRGVHLSFEGEECMIRGNADMLAELIENLAQNAIRYNNEGGKVQVFVGHKDSTPVLTVEDNGIGIPKDQQERVFERFYRVDKSHSRAIGGTGLGLSIVKHVAACHKAEIHLESQLGQGTEIRLSFPGGDEEL